MNPSSWPTSFDSYIIRMMEIEKKVSIFEEKIHEYYQACVKRGIRGTAPKEMLYKWPLYQFKILAIYKSIVENQVISEDLYQKCADKLIDIKLMYCYLDTLLEHFYWGTTLIVGENKLEKLNPNTISLLREDHYKVYLLSVIIENILDFFQIVFQQKIQDYKKGKWEKILEATKEIKKFDTISEENVNILLDFKEKYRAAELHRFSTVRAFTSKEKWNHFQTEEKLVKDILTEITLYFKSLKN